MYTITDEQVSSIETFIGKLSDSLIKSRIEKWFQEAEPTRRITSEQMEQFVGYSTHLPQEVQNFPQSFLMAVKNTPETEKKEMDEGITETADLTYLADDSISNVEDVSAPEDVEETEHTLNKPKKAVSKKAAIKKKK